MSASSTYRTAAAASTIYLAAEVLRMAAGFITMPILTRSLTREEYGLISLSFAVVGILALLGRMGFAEATTRFYFDYKRQGARQLREFCGTMLAGAFLTSTMVMLIALVALHWVADDPHTRACLQLACLIVVVRALLGVIYQVYRAEERPVACSAAQLAARYTSLVIVVAMVVAGRISAAGVILATVLGEALVVVVTVAEIAWRNGLGRPAATRPHLNAAFSYGTPLAFGLYATFFLDYGDRFLIQRYLGLEAVATYAVPYDLIQTLTAALCGSLKLAIMPVIFRLWESEGAAATGDFVSRIFSYAVSFAIPIAALFIATSEDLIVLMSSAKYAASAALTTYLVPGVVIGELNFLIAAGLLVGRGTKTLAALTLASSALNLVLNMLLLPRLGLSGAAWATTTAYGVLMLTTYLASRTSLAVRVQPMLVAAAVLATAIMLGSLSALGQISARPVLNFFLRGSAGAAIAALCMSLFSAEIRQLTWVRLLTGRAQVA